jgi:hypothetical protein
MAWEKKENTMQNHAPFGSKEIRGKEKEKDNYSSKKKKEKVNQTYSKWENVQIRRTGGYKINMLTSFFYSFSGTKRNIQWKKIAEKTTEWVSAVLWIPE